MKKILIFLLLCIPFTTGASFTASSCIYGVLNTTSLTTPSFSCTGGAGFSTGSVSFGTLSYTIAPRTTAPLNWIGLQSETIGLKNCTYTAINTTTRTVTNLSCPTANTLLGIPGPQGPQGLQGIPGTGGTDGITQVILTNSGGIINNITVPSSSSSSTGGGTPTENVYIDPTFDIISDTAVQLSTVPNSAYISVSSGTGFCMEQGGTYVSHTTLSSSTSQAYFTGTGWTLESSSSRISTLICSEIVGATGSTGISGGLSSSWSGSIDSRDYLQLFAVKDGEVFLNQDSFYYFLVVGLVALILMRTLITIVSFFYSSGFYLSSGVKILGKK